jgi:hypothetical protein
VRKLIKKCFLARPSGIKQQKQNRSASDRPWQHSFWPNTTTNQQYRGTSLSIKIIANSLRNFFLVDCCLVASFFNLVKNTNRVSYSDHSGPLRRRWIYILEMLFLLVLFSEWAATPPLRSKSASTSFVGSCSLVVDTAVVLVSHSQTHKTMSQKERSVVVHVLLYRHKKEWSLPKPSCWSFFFHKNAEQESTSRNLPVVVALGSLVVSTVGGYCISYR